jgi:hypothetical protein
MNWTVNKNKSVTSIIVPVFFMAFTNQELCGIQIPGSVSARRHSSSAGL